MGWHLSKQNESILIPFARILSKTKGRVELDTHDPQSLIYILRAGANTKFPELKKWRFKHQLNKVLAIPKDPTIEHVELVTEDLDYLGIINYLVQNKPESALFTSTFLADVEYKQLETACARLEYKMEHDSNGVKIYK